MIIKQDPILGLWCREDGAICAPPSGKKYTTFRWTFGSNDDCRIYKKIRFQGKHYYVHTLICRAFHGLAPADKPFVDHINRIKNDNRPENLHWVSRRENANNTDYVDQSVEKYGIRYCDDSTAYSRAWSRAHRERVSARNKTYYAKHREQVLARSRARYKNKKA